jgi:RNA polymerase sigma factor (sigma-70 family)
MKPRNDEIAPTDPRLIDRLKDWANADSWTLFYDTYWKLIYGAARKSGLTDQEAREVTQETFLAVAKKMDEFKYDPAIGSFKGWLRQLTQWRITDQFRKRGPAFSQSSFASPDATHTRTSTIDRIPDLSTNTPFSEEEWQRNLKDAAIERIKRKVSHKDFQLFEVYVLKDWPVDQVVETMRVSKHQVYQARTRVMKAVRKEVEYLQSKVF